MFQYSRQKEMGMYMGTAMGTNLLFSRLILFVFLFLILQLTVQSVYFLLLSLKKLIHINQILLGEVKISKRTSQTRLLPSVYETPLLGLLLFVYAHFYTYTVSYTGIFKRFVYIVTL